jgi:hypothetical protein
MRNWMFVIPLIVALATATDAVSAADAKVRCQMTFNMAGWSAFYKTSSGTGLVKCSNGQSARVKLEARGGGLTVGKSEIENGRGDFSPVANMGEIFGTYVSAEAHAGAVKSVKAQAMTKGAVSLALAGKGRGFDLGIAFGSLSVEKS